MDWDEVEDDVAGVGEGHGGAAPTPLHMPLRPLQWDVARVADHIVGSLVPGGGTWTMGLYGALAEFCVEEEPFGVRRSGSALTCVSDRGAIRLQIDPAVVSFFRPASTDESRADVIVLAVPRPPERASARAKPSGGDDDALRPQDRDASLCDLGLGSRVARFNVRTRDPGLIDAFVDSRAGFWPEVLEEHGAFILASSPDRVVESPIGRIEVYSPIPPPDGRSPDGPHTHVLPRLLRLGRELPPRLELPADLAPAALYYPHPGTTVDLSA